MFFLQLQEQAITLQLNFFLNRNRKHLKNTIKGCSLNVIAEEENKKNKLNNEVRTILKKYKNNPDLILDYISKRKTKIYKLKNAKQILAKFGEEPGLISSYSGIKALILSTLLLKKPRLKTKPVFIIDNTGIDIYILIQQFHKWYFLENDYEGFDEKSQSLLKAINKGNEDNIIKNLKPNEIIGLQQAIARDVESISFVEQYARETTGSQKALEKIKNGDGARI